MSFVLPMDRLCLESVKLNVSNYFIGSLHENYFGYKKVLIDGMGLGAHETNRSI